MSHFTELKDVLATYLDDEKIELVHQAYLIAEKAHEGQMRRSGDPYITHPVAVATILAHMHLDHESIMAALMHDVLEDTQVDKVYLTERFGPQVADLVDGVSKLTQIHFESRAEAQAENFRKMLLAMVRDIRVILVKLADRLHNMRTLKNMPPKKRRRIAKETLEIYAPIANRLGMHAFRIEFEDLGFAALCPMRYRILSAAVKKARGNRREIINEIKKALKGTLSTHHISQGQVLGRQKHLYGIYRKMKVRHASFAEIMDVYAFRIIVDTADDCYRTLGAVHALYKPIPERFKDYIAMPKANGYQSLHTTLFGPYGVPIEIQIRTLAMDRIAENGIAAHWLYKSPDSAVGDAQLKAREWLKGLLELQQRTGSSLEFIENVKIDLFPEDVYVFTPKGDIIELRRGATAVDFAYAIHSDIGNTCVAAKVERRFAPLSMPLSNGQTVEIVTAPGARPNAAWLNFVTTARARSCIRHYLKTQKRSAAISLGKELLEKSFENLQKDKEIKPEVLQDISKALHYKSVDELYEAIGLGNQMPAVIASRICEKLSGESEVTVSDAAMPLSIKGTEGMVVTYAACCKPLPGDAIVGILKPGRGIEVHREQCSQIAQFLQDANRLMVMCWEKHIQGEFQTDIKIKVMNQRWVLAQLASAISEAEANIDNIVVNQGDGQLFTINLTLLVRDKAHLEKVMKRITAIKVVDGVERI